jgi:hypothetical protein
VRESWIAVVMLAWGGVAGADTVETVRSYWNPAHNAIVSDVVRSHDDGSVEAGQVAGGVVDGIGMIQIPIYGPGDLQVEFVHETNKFGTNLHWAGSCVFITVDSAGTHHVTFDAETQALQAAMNTWNTQPTCSYVRFMMLPPAPIDNVGYDGKNSIKFREDKWCRPGLNCPDDCAKLADPSTCPTYKSAAVALTTLFFVERDGSPDDGTILDVDTELNAVNFAHAVGCETKCVTMATHGSIQDLQDTMTHEFGHNLGLAHTCDDVHNPYSTATAPKDETGQPIPCCNAECGTGNLPAKVTQATMYNYEDSMEISKRTLSDDDINAVCAIYPTASNPQVCAPVEIAASGCSVGGEGRVPGGLLSLVLAGIIVTARACSRSRRP